MQSRSALSREIIATRIFAFDSVFVYGAMLQRLIDHKKADTQTVEPSRITVEFRGQTTIVLRWDNVSPDYEINLQSGAGEMTVNEKSDLETGGGGRRRRK